MRVLTRRTWFRTMTAAPLGALALRGRSASAQPATAEVYGAGTLPAGIRSRLVTGVNGITMHVLEAGFESPGRPGILLCMDFPSSATAGAR